MLLIIAPFPTEENEKDGMVQRIAAIDRLTKDTTRFYLDISFRRHLRATTKHFGNATVFKLNFFFHAWKIASLVRAATLIYLHSANAALKISPFFPDNKVVFDVHGIVPEETAAQGKAMTAWLLSLAERVAIRRSAWVIVVSQRMREHLEGKFGLVKPKFLVYPILPHLSLDPLARDSIVNKPRNPESVIYAGGLQSWQNIDKMIDAASRQRRCSYTFLTGEAKALRELLDRQGLGLVKCESARPDAVADYYLDHALGFILRDQILINQVACPTKLIEYMYWGVLPILITPDIGDFDKNSLQGIVLEDFLNNRIPEDDAQRGMRLSNRNTVESMMRNAQISKTTISQMLLQGHVDNNLH
jgi:hypothetical protein